MAAIDWAAVTGFTGKLADVPVDAQTAILAYVNEVVNVAVLGGEDAARTKLARIYLAAHLGELQVDKNQTGGPVQREIYGAQTVEVDYAAASSSTDALTQTSYGMEYARIIRSSAAAVGFVAGARGRCR